ncbi:hypothetical protein [Sanyastnella coralliicola]|uniref:hypothetical protein n=1 Tax=Sanyastnella coralliicola TaxID=3069118 RepID=UPI0027B9D930|nr:hypothetical protein [Longitalea sp. SCSIO 12813]
MRKLILVIAVIISCVSGHAQLSVGARLTHHNFLETDVRITGIGGFGTYWISNMIGVRAGLSVGFPWENTSTFSAYTSDNSLEPEIIEVEGLSRVTTTHINLNGVGYFGSGYYRYGGFYGVFGLGLVISSEEINFESFPEEYRIIGIPNEGERITNYQFLLRGIAGYEYVLNKRFLFGEIGLGLPLNGEPGTTVPFQVGKYFEASFGVRF